MRSASYILRMQWRTKDVDLPKGRRRFVHVAVQLDMIEVVPGQAVPVRTKVVDRFMEPATARSFLAFTRAGAQAQRTDLTETGTFFTQQTPPEA